jgi:hypothetical protein
MLPRGTFSHSSQVLSKSPLTMYPDTASFIGSKGSPLPSLQVDPRVATALK